MKLRIDGVEVEGSGTILEACRRRGAAIAAPCFDERLGPGGHCRLCMVEADGRLQPACSTPLREGMVVLTDSARLRAYRQDVGELLLAESAPRGAVGELLDRWGAAGERYSNGSAVREPAIDRSHAFVRIDMGACIRCRACVDACAGIQGQFVFAPVGRGGSTRIGWGRGPFAATDCVSCGACVAACPTGAITDADRELPAKTGTAAVRVVRTTCSYCGVGCQLDVHADGDRILAVDGARSPVNDGHLCVKGRYAHAFVRHPDRLTSPLVRRGDRFEAVSWEDAIALVARELGLRRGHLGFLSSSRCTNEENYLVQKWARAGFGTNDVDCCARVCHAPSAAGMRASFGTGAATNGYADIAMADLLLVAGSNTTESHPVLGARVRQAVLSGAARLVVIDPRRTELAALADVHLQPQPGSNVALLNAMASVIVEEGLFDRSFLDSRATGLDELTRFLALRTPEQAEAVTGVAPELVRRAARLYAGARAPMQLHGLGVSEHYQGSEAVMLLCNLAVLCGAVGRDGVGVNPLRGQNNVQGAADMGCQPDFTTGYAAVDSPDVQARFASLWGAPLPSATGRTIPRMYDAIDRGDIRGLYILGEDVATTDPDSHRVRASLARLELLVVQEIFLSDTAKLAHVVLPGASAFEKDGTFTNAERRVQRVREVLAPAGDARADWRILRDLMRATGMHAPYESPRDIYDEVRSAWPALASAGYARLEGDGLAWPVTNAAPGGTRVLHRGAFAAGRMKLHCIDYAPSPSRTGASRPLVLMTGRVLEHYNSGSMTRRSDAVAIAPVDLLEIHPVDAEDRGIADGAYVSIHSASGQAHATARVTTSVLPGCVFLSFHFPETAANAVTSDITDRLTDCPEYKVTPVEVQAVAAGPAAVTPGARRSVVLT